MLRAHGHISTDSPLYRNGERKREGERENGGAGVARGRKKKNVESQSCIHHTPTRNTVHFVQTRRGRTFTPHACRTRFHEPLNQQ